MRHIANPLQRLFCVVIFSWFVLCVFSTPALAADVIEFYNTNLDNYFITTDASEAAAIDSGSAGPGWGRTGKSFKSGGTTPVCRFYGSQSPGPNSHFYTVDAGECQNLKEIQASTPATQPRWNFESLDFISTPTTNGTCPSGTAQVCRAYNNGSTRKVDSNHRITSSLSAIKEVAFRGWKDEGLVMCAADPAACTGKLKCAVTYPSSYKGSFPIPTATQMLSSTVQRSIGLKDYYPGSYQTSDCTDRILYSRNLYLETLDRIKLLGVDQIWIYNYGPWDDLTKSVYMVNKSDFQIPESEIKFIVDEAKKRNIKAYLSWMFAGFDIKGHTIPMPANPTKDELQRMLDSYRQLIVDQARYGEQIGLAGISADWSAFFVANLGSDPQLKEQWIANMAAIIGDIKSVFSGKVVYGANTSVIDSRIASKIDAFIITLLPLPNNISAETNKSLTVDLLKGQYIKNIKFFKDYYAKEMNGNYVDVPISWDILVQSKYDFYVNNWTEDGFCVDTCIQKTYVTDFSVQAIGIEAAMQAIDTQTYFRNNTVNIMTSYWLTDDIVPVEYVSYNGGESDFDFPNLSQSIRNKPAENIVKYWFGR